MEDEEAQGNDRDNSFGRGGFCVLSGIFFMQWGIREFGSCSGQARARVVGIYESPVSQDGGYAPIVEFSAGGETVRSRAMTEKTGSRKRVPYAEEIGWRSGTIPRIPASLSFRAMIRI